MTSSNSRHITIPALLAALVAPASAASAQQTPARESEDRGAVWLAYTGTHPVSPLWRVMLEGQLRRITPVSDPQAWLLRTALIRSLGEHASVGAGYLHQASFRYGFGTELATTNEHRAFQQLELRQGAGPFALNHRYRLEQRWTERLEAAAGGGAERVGWTYTNRTRYQLRATTAPGGGSPQDGEPYLTAYDELFVSFGRNVRGNVFDQNRAFAGAGYRWSRALRLEAGYLHNYVLRSNGRQAERNHTLFVGVFSEAPLR